MLKSIIDKYLKEYFLNYSKDTFNISLVKGEASLNELIVNTEKVNQDFDDLNIPYKMNFGLLKRLKIKGSIIATKLSVIEIEDLIIILAPDATKADRNFRLSGDQKVKVLSEMIDNYKKYTDWFSIVIKIEEKIQQLEKERIKIEKDLLEKFANERFQIGKIIISTFIEKSKKKSIFEVSKEWQEKVKQIEIEKSNHENTMKKIFLSKCKSIPNKEYNHMMSEEKLHTQAFIEMGKLKYMTMEERYKKWYKKFQIIKQSLETKIVIRNVRVHIEDSTSFDPKEKAANIATLCLHFQNVSLDKVLSSDQSSNT